MAASTRLLLVQAGEASCIPGETCGAVLLQTARSSGQAKNGALITNLVPGGDIIRVNLAGAAWGAWGAMTQCPNGKLATSVKQKVESYQGSDTKDWLGRVIKSGDDTALNAVMLKCQDGTEIASTQGAWGNWGGYAHCPIGSYIVGFRLKSESAQGGGDDTTANSISVECSGGSQLFNQLSVPGGGQWGRWSNYATCPEGQGVCGIKTRVESNQGNGDDTSLGDVGLKCCQATTTTTTTTTNQYVFKFDGCPRLAGNAFPPSLTNRGRKSYQECATLCTSEATCSGFETNGCTVDKQCAGGNCWTFTEDATTLTNGNCVTGGSQKTYVK